MFSAAQRTGRFEWEARGDNYIKDKGVMNTYWLKSSKKKSMWEILGKKRGECAYCVMRKARAIVEIT